MDRPSADQSGYQVPAVPSRTSRYFGEGGGSLAKARAVLRERPEHFDQELADTIIELVANGESLNEICQDRDAPLPATFMRWCKEDTRLMDRYRDAQEMGAEVMFEESTSAAFDSDSIRGSIRHKALLTRAERMMPEKYGPRATLRTTKEVEDDSAGIDYAGDVRRRLGAMAERMAPAASGEQQGGGET